MMRRFSSSNFSALVVSRALGIAMAMAAGGAPGGLGMCVSDGQWRACS